MYVDYKSHVLTINTKIIRTVNVRQNYVMRTLIARDAWELPINKIFIFVFKMIMEKIIIRIREWTVLPFINIKSKILVLTPILKTKSSKQMCFLNKRMKGKEEQDKKEQTIEVDIRRLEVVDVKKRHKISQSFRSASILI